MREAGEPSTWVAGCAVHSIVPAPPVVVMVAPPEVSRNAEGTQSKGRVVLPGRVEQRGQQHTHYKGRDIPKDAPARCPNLLPDFPSLLPRTSENTYSTHSGE
jgi:hypothetical protein